MTVGRGLRLHPGVNKGAFLTCRPVAENATTDTPGPHLHPVRVGAAHLGIPDGVAAVTYRNGTITLDYVLKTHDKLRDSCTVVAAH